MKVLIIDDEKAPRAILSNYLISYFKELTIVGEAETIAEAQNLIEHLNPDLIFLDMEIGESTGFNLLDSINIEVKVIVISGHPQFALKAFRYNVMDYLLKPIKLKELEDAIHKATVENESFQQIGRKSIEEGLHKKIAVKSRNDMVLIDERDIVYIRADGSYTHIILKNGNNLFVTKQLKYFESILTTDYFVRVHHSYIVNLTGENVEIDLKQNLIKIMNYSIPVSVRKKSELIAIVKDLNKLRINQ